MQTLLRLARPVAFLLLAPAFLPAQSQPVLASSEYFAGASVLGLRPGSNLDRNWLPGWQLAATRYFNRRLGATADLSGFYGTRDITSPDGTRVPVELRQISLLAGPQLRLLQRRRVQTSFRALFGFANGNAAPPAATLRPPSLNIRDNSFAATFGSAIDFPLSDRFAFRLQPGVFLTRYGGELERNFRVSAGLVWLRGR